MRDYVPPARFIDNATRLYKLLLLNDAIHNADAHLKNFALTYTALDDVALAPVYDILTLTAYPQYANNIPGLTLEGKKVWGCGKALHKYAAQRLQLSAGTRTDAVQRVIGALRETTKRMLDEWEKGLTGILPTSTAKLPPPGEIRESFGMSETEPAQKARNEYVNPDDAFSHKTW